VGTRSDTTDEAGAAAAFLARARQEADRYGPDPWVCIRELLQNARDAGATQVVFEVETGPDGSRLVCRDDGEGMSFEDARRYLFTLYASSKTGARGQAGRFGVGFWSRRVLALLEDALVPAAGLDAVRVCRGDGPIRESRRRLYLPEGMPPWSPPSPSSPRLRPGSIRRRWRRSAPAVSPAPCVPHRGPGGETRALRPCPLRIGDHQPQ
jgi:hypothetical protein